MAKTPAPPKQNLILAELVADWARRYDVTTDAYISGLVNALAETKNLAMWASLDPIAFLPQPRLTSEDRVRAFYRRLNAIRNALVFAPVALTWFAVGQATKAFQTFVDQNSTATVNFLEFWQNGYDVLASEWRISNIAVIDFAIVMAVIVLTIVSNNLSDRSEKRLEMEDRELQSERMELAIAIKEYLYSKQTLTRATLNAGVATAIENLVEATENLKSKPRKKRRK